MVLVALVVVVLVVSLLSEERRGNFVGRVDVCFCVAFLLDGFCSDFINFLEEFFICGETDVTDLCCSGFEGLVEFLLRTSWSLILRALLWRFETLYYLFNMYKSHNA